MQTTAADERIFRWKEHRQKLLPKPVVEVLHRKEVDVSPVIQQMSKKIQPSAVKRVSANSTRIMPVMRDTLVFPADMQTAAGRQSAAVLYAAADRGIWAADCRPASERRKGMEQLTDYSINFPHLHIYLHHVGKNIMIGNFSVAYYGIVIAIGMLAGLGIACWMAKRTGQKTDTYFDLALVAIICSVIGARVYYVIFRWDLYKDDLLSVFNLRQGGLAIYGGVIAAIITVFVFSRVRKLSMGLLCDTAGLGLVLGQVIGRWGNFFNREAFGGYTDGLFAMQLPLSAVRSSDVTDSLLVADIEVRDNIEITQMITKFNELAVRDGFTKLYNKTFINNELESLVQAARGGSPAGEAAVVLLDIDGFKQINDTYGAPKGLSEGDLERLFAEIDAIERHAFQAEAGSFSLAASCGVCFVRPDDTVRSLLDRADVAMYRAKESGRRWVER